MINKFFIFISLLLLGVVLPVVTANAYVNYPTKTEYDNFIDFVTDYVDSDGGYVDVYPYSIDDYSYIRYTSDIVYPTGTTYQNCIVEITLDDISIQCDYVLRGIDSNIQIDFTFFCTIHLYIEDMLTGINNYTSQYFEYDLPVFEYDVTPFQLVREGIPQNLSELDLQTAYTLCLVNRVTDVTPFSTSSQPGIMIVNSYHDANIEDYNFIPFDHIFNAQSYGPFALQLSRLGVAPNYTSVDDRTIILAENIRVDIPNFLYTYTLAKNYGGVKVLNPLQDVSFVDWVVNAIGGFMDFEIAPGISLSVILMFILSLGLLVILLKLFAGG